MNTIIEHPTFTDTTATSSEGRFTILTPNRQAKFLQHLQVFGNVRLASGSAGISAQTAYRARRASPGFALAWDAALVAARTHAEATLADRAIHGVEEAVYYHGEEVARRRRFDSRLLLAHLARLDRMEQREELSAALPLLDACIDALEEGADIDDLMGAHPGRAGDEGSSGGGAENFAQDRVPSVPSCRNVEEDQEDALPPMEARLQAMEAARPPEAVALCDQVTGALSMGEIEALQLAAFEAGVEQWWLITRAEDGACESGFRDSSDRRILGTPDWESNYETHEDGSTGHGERNGVAGGSGAGG